MTRGLSPLEDLYFKWLVGPLDRCWSMSFPDDMLLIMHRTRFESYIGNDQNRAADGVRLREEFLYRQPVKSSQWEIDGFLMEECSILEMLLALAERCEYQTGDKAVDWFATFVRNLSLPDTPERTRKVLQRLNNREYDYDGRGGLFPLQDPVEDQRQTEIWYQMSAYIIEGYEENKCWTS